MSKKNQCCGGDCGCKRELPELDPNVVSVMEKHKTRAEVGFKKYGVDTTRTDTDLLGWLNHLQEELMDANVYIERTMVEIGEREAALEVKEAELKEKSNELDEREHRLYERMTES